MSTDIIIKDKTVKNQYDAAKTALERAAQIRDFLQKVENGEATDSDVDKLLRDSFGDLIGETPLAPLLPLYNKVGELIEFCEDPTGKTPEEYAKEVRVLDALLTLSVTLGKFFGRDMEKPDLPKIRLGGRPEWERGKDWTPPRDPLVLDLDGDGIETIGVDDWNNTVLFDHNTNGIKVGTGWVSSDDGLLVMDRDGNGSIDNGWELFGDNTLLGNGELAANAYEALAELDSNSDGLIDLNDTNFGKLKVWQDLNQDGISQDNELITLTELGIQSISTSQTEASENQNGNTVFSNGVYTKIDGTIGVTGGLLFDSSTFHTEYPDDIAITEQALSLPNMHGSGRVRNLRQAASLSGDLANLLEIFSETHIHSEQAAVMDGLIEAWASTSDMSSMTQRALDANFIVKYTFGNVEETPHDGITMTSGEYTGKQSYMSVDDFYGGRGEEFEKWMRIISILERFNGEEFVDFTLPEEPDESTAIVMTDSSTVGSYGGYGTFAPGLYHRVNVNISQAQLDLLQQSYDALKKSLFTALATETRIQDYVGAISLDVVEGLLIADTSGVTALLTERFAEDQETAIWDALFLRTEFGNTDPYWDPLLDLRDILQATSSLTLAAKDLLEEEKIYLADAPWTTRVLPQEAKIVFLSDTDDTLRAHPQGAVVYGEGGNDELYGSSGKDILDGADGNDTL
ncbi:MAG: hypothetical protein P8179_15910, partial [Candidatus Thiodiazotropha sp.]